MVWVHPTSWTIYTTIESIQSVNIPKIPPFILIHIFILYLGRGAWHLACVRGYFQYQRSTYKPMYMMACMYTLWWLHIYIHLPILPSKDILSPQGPNISFPNNFTKKNCFLQKFELFLIRLGDIFPNSQ